MAWPSIKFIMILEWYIYMVPKRPSHVINFWTSNSNAVHSSLITCTGIPLVNIEVSIPGFLSMSFHAWSSTPLFLNHLSPTWGRLVDVAMVFSVIVNFRSPTYTVFPLKDRANAFVTSLSYPLNFSMNFNHFSFFSASFVWGYPSKYFGPSGSGLSSFPIFGSQSSAEVLTVYDFSGRMLHGKTDELRL